MPLPICSQRNDTGGQPLALTRVPRSINLARGLKKHLKRLNAPKHWMLDKLGGAFAPKPSSGPHKSRECLSLILIYVPTFRF
ncbi:hypothetical protein ACS0TY_003097 [Phlomoides rotata]